MTLSRLSMTMVPMHLRNGRCSSLLALLASVCMPGVAFAAPPSNDKCPGAEVIPAAGPFPHLTQLIPDVSQATMSGDPLPSCVSSFSRGTWYSFTPAVTAEYRISTCNPSTHTTVWDTVIGVFTSSNNTCTGSMNEIQNGCGDDECQKRSAVAVTLTAGRTYYIVAAKWGAGLPDPGETAMQVEVTKNPENDSCENAPSLSLNQATVGSLTLGTNNYEVSISAPNCYSLPMNPFPIGEPISPSPTAGRDAVYKFTAPEDGSYSFRAQDTLGGGNLVLYAATSCPTGSGVHTVTDCLGAVDRNGNVGDYSAAEELVCVPFTAGQTAYVYVDEALPTTVGARFTLEATKCEREVEPNDGPSEPSPLGCGLTGTIFPAFDEDFYAIGPQPAGTRVFAMADGVTANGADFDLRITTETDTLEYDDSNNSIAWGEAGPNIAGCPLPADPSFVKVNYFGGMLESEPYHLYTVVQPPGMGLGGSSATPETEPNNTIAAATKAGNLFFSGTISTGGPMGDRDLFQFCAEKGDLIYLSADGDPLRDATPLDPMIFLWDESGIELLRSADTANFSTTFPNPNTLSGTTPFSPGEAGVFRAQYTGLYYAGIMTTLDGAPYSTGDYLYSIGINCLNGTQLETDLTISVTDSADPVGSDEPLTLTVEVANQGPRTAMYPHWTMTLPPNVNFMGLQPPPEWTCKVTGAAIDCTTTCFSAGDTATFVINLQTPVCIMGGQLMHVATVTGSAVDSNAANNTAIETTNVVDGGPCDDGDACTAGDVCMGGACVSGPPNDCNDNNPCTNDACLPGTGCAHTNNTNTCDDADVCTIGETCINGQCTPASHLDCDDGDVCTDNPCDPLAGCMTEFNTAPCEEGDFCTVEDRCKEGACVAGVPRECTPLNDCQEVGTCDSAAGACSYPPKPDGTTCDDGNACSLNDTCKSGTCSDFVPVVCPPPANECLNAGVCNPLTGSCEYSLFGGDLDGDGQGDRCDDDIDGDGIVNDEEVEWGTNPMSKDSDGDTIDDCTEACPRNDGSCFDGPLCSVDEPANTDGDDTIDALDSDSDNDGASDALEAGDDDLTTPPVDADGNGIPEYRESNIDDYILSGGCGCTTTSAPTNTAPVLWAGGLSLLAWGRRRRKRQIVARTTA